MTSQKGLSAYSDGILGLALGNTEGKLHYSYIAELYEQGVIDRALVGIYLSEDDGLSNIQIGNYNTSYINGTAQDIVYFDKYTYSDYWYIDATVFYSVYQLGYGYYPYIVDTGNRKIGFPADLWVDFMAIIEDASDSIICDDITCYGQEFNCSVYDKNLTEALEYI